MADDTNRSHHSAVTHTADDTNRSHHSAAIPAGDNPELSQKDAKGIKDFERLNHADITDGTEHLKRSAAPSVKPGSDHIGGESESKLEAVAKAGLAVSSPLAFLATTSKAHELLDSAVNVLNGAMHKANELVYDKPTADLMDTAFKAIEHGDFKSADRINTKIAELQDKASKDHLGHFVDSVKGMFGGHHDVAPGVAPHELEKSSGGPAKHESLDTGIHHK
jgi:hypothetical protein